MNGASCRIAYIFVTIRYNPTIRQKTSRNQFIPSSYYRFLVSCESHAGYRNSERSTKEMSSSSNPFPPTLSRACCSMPKPSFSSSLLRSPSPSPPLPSATRRLTASTDPYSLGPRAKELVSGADPLVREPARGAGPLVKELANGLWCSPWRVWLSLGLN